MPRRVDTKQADVREDIEDGQALMRQRISVEKEEEEENNTVAARGQGRREQPARQATKQSRVQRRNRSTRWRGEGQRKKSTYTHTHTGEEELASHRTTNLAVVDQEHFGSPLQCSRQRASRNTRDWASERAGERRDSTRRRHWFPEQEQREGVPVPLWWSGGRGSGGVCVCVCSV
jgi:hypothetical protein